MKITDLTANLGVLLGAALAGAQDPPQIPTFASKVELVTVDAVVMDGEGRPVRGLAAEDFVLSEDGKPQRVESFEAIDLGEGPEGSASTTRPSPEATNLRPASRAARSFVLLVDDMSLAPARQPVVRSAIARFVEAGLRDGDEVIFATTSADVWWSARMPEGREDLEALAARVTARSFGDSARDAQSEWEAYQINHHEIGAGEEPGALITARVVQRYMARRVCDPLTLSLCHQIVKQRAREVDQRRINRTQDALAAVDRAIFALTGVRGRKSLLLLSEGFLDDTSLPFVRDVAGRCREANLVVYFLDVRGLMSGQPTAEESGVPNLLELARRNLEETVHAAEGSVGLAEDTGGFAVQSTNDLGAGAARVADESRTYYLLGYAPPEGKGPRDWRRLKVEVKRPGVKVRARKGYTLRPAAEIARAAAAPLEVSGGRKPKGKGSQDAQARASVAPDVSRSLATAHDADAIPLRAMAYTFEDRPSGTVRTMVTVEIDARGRTAERRGRSVFSLTVVAAHRDRVKAQRLDQRLETEADPAKQGDGWLTLHREFDLPPGVVQARIVVRDETQGHLGALTLRFVVPEPSALRLSTPVITDRATGTNQAGPPRPVPTAHREFTPTGRIYCQFQVFGPPKAAIEASYVLRARNGAVVDHRAPTPIGPSPDGRLVRLLVLSLEGMKPGDYELVLHVANRATGETREQVESFRIRPTHG